MHRPHDLTKIGPRSVRTIFGTVTRGAEPFVGSIADDFNFRTRSSAASGLFCIAANA